MALINEIFCTLARVCVCVDSIVVSSVAKPKHWVTLYVRWVEAKSFIACLAASKRQDKIFEMHNSLNTVGHFEVWNIDSRVVVAVWALFFSLFVRFRAHTFKAGASHSECCWSMQVECLPLHLGIWHGCVIESAQCSLISFSNWHVFI